MAIRARRPDGAAQHRHLSVGIQDLTVPVAIEPGESNAVASTTIKAPSSSGTGMEGPFVVIAVIAVIAVAGILVLRRRRA